MLEQNQECEEETGDDFDEEEDVLHAAMIHGQWTMENGQCILFGRLAQWVEYRSAVRANKKEARFTEFSYDCTTQGRLAQWLEHLVYTERVGGSNPLAPTTL